MKRTYELIVLALGVLVLRGVGVVRVVSVVGPATISANHSKTSIDPAEDSGDDDGDDDAGSDDTK